MKIFTMAKKLKYLLPILAILIVNQGCERALDVVPKDELAPGNVLTSGAGIKALLFSSYSNIQNQANYHHIINFAELCTETTLNSGGNANLIYNPILNFTWDASLGQFNGVCWAPYYQSIRDANLVLENINNISDLSDQLKKQNQAEARFLRAYAYTQLYNYFGPVPLRTSTGQEPNLPRAADAEIKNFIETELNASVADLPAPGREEAFGRATKGSALAVLAKFTLNTKQWQKAADAAKMLMDLNYYQLYPVFKDMFKVEHEGNKEMIWVVPCTNSKVNLGNWYPCGAMPLGFSYTDQLPEYKWNPAVQNFATKYRLRDAFIRTFDTTDKRFVLVVRKFVNTSGQVVDLTRTANNTCCLKYFDNNGLKNENGNDIPLFRYADMLITRAEALNELNGPAQEAFNLINQVRTRAGIPNLTTTNIATKDAFRDAILRERGWEFMAEGKRREDLIRQGKFVSGALARGITTAKPMHVVFPIPQVEVDANPMVVQTSGY